jgi:hypothetical protein
MILGTVRGINLNVRTSRYLVRLATLAVQTQQIITKNKKVSILKRKKSKGDGGSYE